MEIAVWSEIKTQEILSNAQRIGGEVISDVVEDTEKRLGHLSEASGQRREILRKEIQENLENLSFIEKHNIYSYEQLETHVANLQQKHKSCNLSLDEARKAVQNYSTLLSLPATVESVMRRMRNNAGRQEYMQSEDFKRDYRIIGKIEPVIKKYALDTPEGVEKLTAAKQKMEQRIAALQGQADSLAVAISDCQKCRQVWQRIDHENGGRRAQTFRRTEKTAQPRTESQAVERLKSKMETMQGQSQQTRQRGAAPPIGGRATEAAQGAYGRLEEKSRAIKEKMERGSQPKLEAAPSAKREDFSFAALLDAQKEAFAESAAFHDTRPTADPAILASPQELREAVAGLEAARHRMKAIPMPSKPSLFASREVKDRYEQECRERREQLKAAEAECTAQFEKVVSFGVRHYAYIRELNFSTEIKPPFISAEEMKQLKDFATEKLKDLERIAEQERQRSKPADAPTTTPERYRAAVERYRVALHGIPAEYQREAGKALTDALSGYQSQNGFRASNESRHEIGAIMRRELPASREQVQARTKSKDQGHER